MTLVNELESNPKQGTAQRRLGVKQDFRSYFSSHKCLILIKNVVSSKQLLFFRVIELNL